MARKLSSMPRPRESARRMLGVMTVAMLCVSILLPLSSSTWEKEAAQLRNANKTSTESLWLLGSRQHVRCSTRVFFSSLPISTKKLASRKRLRVEKNVSYSARS